MKRAASAGVSILTTAVNSRDTSGALVRTVIWCCVMSTIRRRDQARPQFTAISQWRVVGIG